MDIQPILYDGTPLPDGNYTQTAICPTTSWANGYVRLSGDTVMTIPFTTSALVFVPKSDTSMYPEFEEAMNTYQSGKCYSMSANMATLLNGN